MPKSSILIVLIAGIGDTVLGSRSMRAIRNGYPGADIHLLVNSDAASLAANYPSVDKVHSFPIRKLRENKSSLFPIIQLVRDLRKIRFDVILNLYGVGSLAGALKMGMLFFFLRGREKIGWGVRGLGWFLTKPLPPEPFQNHHSSDAMMEVARASGGVPDQKGIELFWDPGSEESGRVLIPEGPAGSGLRRIAINPGGDRANKRWPPASFAAVADRLAAEFPSRIFILGGPGEETVARTVQENMKHPAENLCGTLTLNELAYLLSRFDLLITNDSGPMHMAAAVRTPVVGIFGPGNPDFSRPYTSPDLFRTVWKPLACRPCNKIDCAAPRCLEQITPDEVHGLCRELLLNICRKTTG